MSFSRLGLFLFTLYSVIHSDSSFVLNNSKLGVETVLPGSNWKLLEYTNKQTDTYAYLSPSGNHFSLIYFRKNIYKNMKQRSQELNQDLDLYQEISMKSISIDGEKVEQLIYRAGKFHTIEVGRLVDNTFLILQLTTHIAEWQDDQRYTRWENVFYKCKWLQKNNRVLDKATYQEIQQMRNQQQQAAVEIKKHNIHITAKKNVLYIRDTLFIKAKKNTSKFSLYTTLEFIQKINTPKSKTKIKWRLQNPKQKRRIITLEKNIVENQKFIIIIYARIPWNYKKNTEKAILFPITYLSKTIYNFTFQYPKKYNFISNFYSNHKVIAKKNINRCKFQAKIVAPHPQNFTFMLGDFSYQTYPVSSKNKLIVLNFKTPQKIRDALFPFLQKIQKITSRSIYFDIIITQNDLQDSENVLHINETQKITISQKTKRNIVAMWLSKCNEKIRFGIASYLTIWKDQNYLQKIKSIEKKYRSLALKKEWAIANPNSIKTPKVNTIKIPLVLAILNKQITEKQFAQGWKRILSNKQTVNCDNIYSIFGIENLKPFLFRPGLPQIEIEWVQKDINVFVKIQQKKVNAPFKIQTNIQVKTPQKIYNFPILLEQYNQTWIIVLPEKVKSMELTLY